MKTISKITLIFLCLTYSCKNVDLDQLSKIAFRIQNQKEALTQERDALDECLKPVNAVIPNTDPKCSKYTEDQIKDLITLANNLFDSLEASQDLLLKELSKKELEGLNENIDRLNDKGYSETYPEVIEIKTALYNKMDRDNYTRDSLYAVQMVKELNAENSTQTSSINTSQSIEESEYSKEDIYNEANNNTGIYYADFNGSKIEIGIIKISNDGIVSSAYNIYKGKRTEMTGKFIGEPFKDLLEIIFTLNEPKGNSNGTFTIHFNPKTSNFGKWESYDGKLKRDFELNQEN